MPDQLEIRGPDGERLVVPVRDTDFMLGSNAAADVRLGWPGIADVHLRFVRTSKGGVRVEPARPGGTVTVNGEELFCKDLDEGDVIAAAAATLRWLPGPPVPAAASPSGVPREAATPLPTRGPQSAATAVAATPGTRTRTAAPERSPQRARRSRTPTWVSVLVLLLVCGFAALVAYRHFSGSTWPSSPQHYVDLARAQLANQRKQEALDTLAFALREAAGATREEALRLEADIKRMLLDAAELPKVSTARQEHDLLLEYLGRYLRDQGERPAAREFVRLCDQWLARHSEVCGRVTEGQPLLRAVQEQRSRWLPLAAMEQPETAADVVFAARTRLRFQWRDYRGAMARFDAFLAANPGDAVVGKERDAVLAEGLEWLGVKLRTIDSLLSSGDRDNAERELTQLERWSVLPSWAAMVAERRQRLAGAR